MALVFNYDRTLDEKNRIQIPTEFREGMDLKTEWFYLCPGERDNTLAVYRNRLWEEKVSKLQTGNIASERALEFEQWYFPRCCRLDTDAQGRVVLPKWQLDEMNLGKEITLAGAFDRIDVWRTAEFREFQAAGRREWPKNRMFLRMAASGWKETSPSSSA